jgi:hypothetical protein
VSCHGLTDIALRRARPHLTDIGRDVPARAIVRFQSAGDLTAHMILGTLSATLNAPVKETAMMSPKGISEKRSNGLANTRTASYGRYDFGAAPL